MSLFTTLRIVSALLVLVVLGLTATLAYHIRVEPVGGPFTRLLPAPGSLDPHREAAAYARSLQQREIPDIEPGEQAYRRAREMMASGRMEEARAKLSTIFNIFPNSALAQNARRIVGEMNLDRTLGTIPPPGASVHRVRPGDSYLGIASQHQTSIEMMVHLNSMDRLRGIRPGDELLVMPLNFRLRVEPRRQAVSLWDGGTFLCEFPALSVAGVPDRASRTTIQRKAAEIDSGNVPSHDERYPTADKFILLASPSLQIRAWREGDEDQDPPPAGILLEREHMEELSLLTRPGNTVEFR